MKESLSVLVQHNNDIDEKLKTLKRLVAINMAWLLILCGTIPVCSQSKGQLAKAKRISGGIPSENVIPTSIEEETLTDQANKVHVMANDITCSY